jgi:hypothetical protein
MLSSQAPRHPRTTKGHSNEHQDHHPHPSPRIPSWPLTITVEAPSRSPHPRQSGRRQGGYPRRPYRCQSADILGFDITLRQQSEGCVCQLEAHTRRERNDQTHTRRERNDQESGSYQSPQQLTGVRCPSISRSCRPRLPGWSFEPSGPTLLLLNSGSALYGARPKRPTEGARSRDPGRLSHPR